MIVVAVGEGGGRQRQYRPISLALQIVRKSIRRWTKRREDNAEVRLLGDVTLQTRSRWADRGCRETGTTDRSYRADPGGWDGMWVKATRATYMERPFNMSNKPKIHSQIMFKRTLIKNQQDVKKKAKGNADNIKKNNTYEINVTFSLLLTVLH